MNLEKIYQQTILEYSGKKDLNREMENPTYVERGHNPNCGDDLTLEVKVNEDNVIEDAAFIGTGCAISTASMAMLIDLIKGKTMKEAEEKVDLFFKMMDISEDKENYSLLFSDNGCGFEKINGEELKSIKERLKAVNGKVNIISSKKPTTIKITIIKN